MENHKHKRADAAHRSQNSAMRCLTRSGFNIDTLVQALIQADAKQCFVDDCETIYKTWVGLLERTSLPNGATYIDNRVGDVLGTLNGMITEPNGLYESRLAHVQLLRFTTDLDQTINRGRRSGLVECKNGIKNAAVIGDLYPGDLVKAKRVAKRWAVLSGTSPLLLFVFTDLAEKLIANPYFTHEVLGDISKEVLRLCPHELIYALREMEWYGEHAMKNNIEYDSKLTQYVLNNIKKVLA